MPPCQCGCGLETRLETHRFVAGHWYKWSAGQWESRFWSKVEKSDGCWLWRGAKYKANYKHSTRYYGKFYFQENGKRYDITAHRMAYRLTHGDIPDCLVIDHLCRNTLCVNPDHLEAVTQSVNLGRGETVNATNKAKTHCVNGHEFTPENTFYVTTRPTTRVCRECSKIRSAKYARNSKQEGV